MIVQVRFIAHVPLDLHLHRGIGQFGQLSFDRGYRLSVTYQPVVKTVLHDAMWAKSHRTVDGCGKYSGRASLQAVLVVQARENRPHGDAVRTCKVVPRDGHPPSRIVGNPWTQGGMRPFAIVMSDPLGERAPQVPVVERKHPIQTLSTGCPDHAFTERVLLWHADRCLHHAQMHRRERSVEGGVHRSHRGRELRTDRRGGATG